MAITKESAVVEPYRRSSPPERDARGQIPTTKAVIYLDDELKKIQHKLDRMITLLPTVSNVEPEVKYVPMIRYAIAPWDPLGTGDGFVYWDGASWLAL